MAVGMKKSRDPAVTVIPNDEDRDPWARAWLRLADQVARWGRGIPGAGRFQRFIQLRIGQPRRWRVLQQGFEDFEFPGTRHLLTHLPNRPDIVHCHNLHGAWLTRGGYFDLRALPWLSQQQPVVLTLHDAWLLSGHCAHSFACERWRQGCGQCPDLGIYPAIRRDATAENWRRKREIYGGSRVFVSTPCRWLMRKVQQSMLWPAVVGARVIPYGVDHTCFTPGDQLQARDRLGIPQDAWLCVFAANSIRRNPWKDYVTLRSALALVAEHRRQHPVMCVALGEPGPPESLGRTRIHFVPYQHDPRVVADYYRAADVYVHAAKVDTFPNTILEALACGKPVVASAIGGIPEQVKALAGVGSLASTTPGELRGYQLEQATGALVPPGDAEALAQVLLTLLDQDGLRHRLGKQAAQDAHIRFTLEREVQDYLRWFEDILLAWRHGQSLAPCEPMRCSA